MDRTGNDSCVLHILDSLTSYTFKKRDTSMLSLLDKLCSESDGYISEYFEDVSDSLFYHHLRMFLKWEMKHADNCLEQQLVWDLSYDTGMMKAIKYIRQYKKQHWLSYREENCINYIFKKAENYRSGND